PAARQATRPAIQPQVPPGAPGYLSDPAPAAPGRSAAPGSDGTEALFPSTIAFEPVRLEEVPEDQDEGPRFPLFYIGDKPYTVPAQPRMGLGFEFLHIARTQGEVMAYDFLMTEMLGAEGWRALCQYRGKISAEQYATIVSVAERLTVGALEVPKVANA
ncbi:MAG: hypothetical protein JWO67_6151, partial [Streptosporangiaceae bacterium]|nr:hypothetical protein [Streptosporangiaceae bacterium]